MFALTLPEKVSAYLADFYSKKSIVLEYGTGGSTFLALEANDQNLVFSGETDSQWLNRLCMEVSLRGLSGRFYPVYQDIGATEKWGKPDYVKEPYSDSRGMRMVKAPWLPWDVMKKVGVAPDIVLIDGRFRVACFLTCWANIKQPTTIVFDDYGDRPHYHVVEKLAKPVEMIDRAAVFKLTPHTGEIDHQAFLASFATQLINPA